MRMEIFEKTFDTRLSTSAREKPKAVVFGVKKNDDFCPRNVKARKKKGRREEAFSFLFKGGQ